MTGTAGSSRSAVVRVPVGADGSRRRSAVAAWRSQQRLQLRVGGVQCLLDGTQAGRLYRNSLESIEVLESATIAVLGRSAEGIALEQLCLEVGREARHWQEGLWPALADPISAHLKRLIARGKVQRVAKGAAGCYRWC